jgi:predicted esterase YcpF (UPF0227 family)
MGPAAVEAFSSTGSGHRAIVLLGAVGALVIVIAVWILVLHAVPALGRLAWQTHPSVGVTILLGGIVGVVLGVVFAAWIVTCICVAAVIVILALGGLSDY